MSRSWTGTRNDLVLRSDVSTSGTASRPLDYSIVHAKDQPRVLEFLPASRSVSSGNREFVLRDPDGYNLVFTKKW
jgi:hypothetical protein